MQLLPDFQLLRRKDSIRAQEARAKGARPRGAALCGTRLLSACVPLLLAACAVGPDYRRPTGAPISRYTEAPLPAATGAEPVPGGGRQVYQPGRDIPGEWWTLFGRRRSPPWFRRRCCRTRMSRRRRRPCARRRNSGCSRKARCSLTLPACSPTPGRSCRSPMRGSRPRPCCSAMSMRSSTCPTRSTSGAGFAGRSRRPAHMSSSSATSWRRPTSPCRPGSPTVPSPRPRWPARSRCSRT